MASKVSAGVPASITVSLDNSGYFVGFTMYDDSGVNPVLVTGEPGQINNVFPAYNYKGNAYRVQLPFIESSRWYLLHIGVYTDDTYTSLSTEEPQGDDSIYFEDVAAEVLDVSAASHNTPGTIGAAINGEGGSSGGTVGIVGIVGQDPNAIIGVVGQDPNGIIGIIGEN